ncbi:MAG: hypothetical protein KGK07_07665 [Chloroflexota bacterium]|nr:hypothetical protein [Chloroflexota bacterium]
MRGLMHMPLVVVVLLVALLALATGVLADNTDQSNNGSRYAWGENIGWLKARPASEAYAAGGSGVQVTDTDVLGYLWGENIGWVNLSCKNDASCAGPAGNWGVKNDGAGHLSGYAWGENVGWINFSCSNDGSCGTANFGVTIATPGPYDYLADWGIFHGYAWAENVGWISFNCQNDSTCGTAPYQAQSGWPNSSGDGYTDAQHIALSKDPFTYCPIMRADVNGSGTVNIFDLANEAQHYGQLIPPGPARDDQNSDRKINIFDLALTAQQYGKSVTACP